MLIYSVFICCWPMLLLFIWYIVGVLPVWFCTPPPHATASSRLVYTRTLPAHLTRTLRLHTSTFPSFTLVRTRFTSFTLFRFAFTHCRLHCTAHSLLHHTSTARASHGFTPHGCVAHLFSRITTAVPPRWVRFTFLFRSFLPPLWFWTTRCTFVTISLHTLRPRFHLPRFPRSRSLFVTLLLRWNSVHFVGDGDHCWWLTMLLFGDVIGIRNSPFHVDYSHLFAHWWRRSRPAMLIDIYKLHCCWWWHSFRNRHFVVGKFVDLIRCWYIW